MGQIRIELSIRDTMMRFIFKLVFWSFLGLMILPSFTAVEPNAAELETKTSRIQSNSISEFTSFDALQFAAGVAGDLKGLCQREPEICETGGKIFGAAIERARDGALVVASMVDQHRAEKRIELDAQTTASVN